LRSEIAAANYHPIWPDLRKEDKPIAHGLWLRAVRGRTGGLTLIDNHPDSQDTDART
jgi:hypothetical protein